MPWNEAKLPYVWATCLPKKALEEGARQHVPGNGVSDGGENPVELPQRCLPVCLLAWDAVNQLLCQPLLPHQTSLAEPPQSNLQSRSQFKHAPSDWANVLQ